jgi:hypothetical protein
MLLSSEVTGDKKYAGLRRQALSVLRRQPARAFEVAEGAMRRNPVPQHARADVARRVRRDGRVDDRARAEEGGPDMRRVIDRFAEYVSTKQFRLEDGLLARKSPFPKSIWLDDAYMSVPLLAQYGKLTGERKYFDDAAKQLKVFTSTCSSRRRAVHARGNAERRR